MSGAASGEFRLLASYRTGLSINTVQLLGGVADAPTQRVARNGKEYCTFNLFTNITQRRADGSFAEHVDLHHVVVHGGLARFVGNNVQRGECVDHLHLLFVRRKSRPGPGQAHLHRRQPGRVRPGAAQAVRRERRHRAADCARLEPAQRAVNSPSLLPHDLTPRLFVESG